MDVEVSEEDLLVVPGWASGRRGSRSRGNGRGRARGFDDGARLLVIADFGDASDLPVLPRLFHSVAERDPRQLAFFLAKRVQQFSRVPVLMLCARAASGATATVSRASRVSRAGRSTGDGSTDSSSALAASAAGLAVSDAASGVRTRPGATTFTRRPLAA